jgi:hypothetical protein
MAKGNELLLLIKGDNEDLKKSLEEINKKLDQSEKKIKESTNKMGGFFSKLGSIIAAKIGIDTIKHFVNLAGVVDSVEKSFASQGTVSDLDIMTDANLAFQLMGDQVAESLPKLMEIAVASAKAKGKEVKTAFNEIITATGRQTIMILDNLGISSQSASKGMDEFANKLKKSRKNFTATEKAQAFFYATMKAGQELIDSTGGKTLTFGQRLQVMQARFDNLQVAISRKFIPAMESLDLALNDTSEDSINFAKIIGKVFSSLIVVISLAIQVIKSEITTLRSVFNKTMSVINDTAAENLERLSRAFNKFSFGKNIAKNLLETSEGFRQNAIDNRKSVNEMESSLIKHSDTTSKILNKLQQIWTDTSEEQRLQSTKTRNTVVKNEKDKRDARNKTLKELKESEYLAFIGQRLESELAKEKERATALLTLYNTTEEQKIQIAEASLRRQQAIREKNNKWHQQSLNKQISITQQAGNTISDIFRSALHETIWGKDGWREWRKQTKEILKQFVTDVIVATVKILALRVLAGGVGSSVAPGLGTALIGSVLEKGRVPSFEKGRMPVFQSGVIPPDHFPALIGAKEAVINERSTRANADLLQAINNSGGKKIDAGTVVNQTNNFTGNVMTEEFIDRQVTERLEENARRQGTTLYSRQGI